MAYNSRQYEWADLSVFLGSKEITGFTAINYSEKIEREAIYAKGRRPYSVQSGNISYEGSLSLLQSELDTLVKAGKGSILSLALDCVVSYGNPANGDDMTTDRIEGIRFTEDVRDWKQGDKNIEINIPFIAINVVRNI